MKEWWFQKANTFGVSGWVDHRKKKQRYLLLIGFNLDENFTLKFFKGTFVCLRISALYNPDLPSDSI